MGRSPHGERGLKCTGSVSGKIEISRSPHGERGLKCTGSVSGKIEISRSPHGERGLKFVVARIPVIVEAVAPRTGSVG